MLPDGKPPRLKSGNQSDSRVDGDVCRCNDISDLILGLSFERIDRDLSQSGTFRRLRAIAPHTNRSLTSFEEKMARASSGPKPNEWKALAML